MIYSRIAGTGSYLPERVMTNADFAARGLDTNDAWIRERTGIERRHIAEKTQASSDLALEASRRALYADVQRIVAEEAPYISLWCKTNAAVARRDLTGIHILPIADFTFLKDVARESSRDARRAGF